MSSAAVRLFARLGPPPSCNNAGFTRFAQTDHALKAIAGGIAAATGISTHSGHAHDPVDPVATAPPVNIAATAPAIDCSFGQQDGALLTIDDERSFAVPAAVADGLSSQKFMPEPLNPRNTNPLAIRANWCHVRGSRGLCALGCHHQKIFRTNCDAVAARVIFSQVHGNTNRTLRLHRGRYRNQSDHTTSTMVCVTAEVVTRRRSNHARP